MMRPNVTIAINVMYGITQHNECACYLIYNVLIVPHPSQKTQITDLSLGKN